MDISTYERLSHSLDGTTSRRQALKLVGGGLAGGLVAATGLHVVTAKPKGRADLLTNFPVDGSVTDAFENDGTFAGTATITQFSLDEDGNLFADGNLSGTLNGVLDTAGVAITELENEDFSGVPVTLGQEAAASAAKQGFLQPQQQSCDILILAIEPLLLDLLGLVIDLDVVNLEIRAERGPGKLLGNLLCELAGLLDDFDLSGATPVVDQINGLLEGGA